MNEMSITAAEKASMLQSVIALAQEDERMELAKVSAQAELSRARMEVLIGKATIMISLLRDEQHVKITVDQGQFVRFFLGEDRYITIYFNEMYVVCGGLKSRKVLFETRLDHHMTALTFAARKVGDFIAYGKFRDENGGR
ncbi:hypothetical protein [Microvirga aerophila]|uniref:Uncharacterized protein n=1 Tax=Microvirga aerophila TaxID=670291 RepID=A0A512C4V6_9HYPH|nr:hypothetical protein [Microvirga aerophila]GEO19200.1 hypothetical protein MAE02_68960 [Microvirga aerophila]